MQNRLLIVAIGIGVAIICMFLLFGGHAGWVFLLFLALGLMGHVRHYWYAVLAVSILCLLLIFLIIPNADPLKIGFFSVGRTSWHGIVTFFQTSWQAVVTFFSSLFSAGGGLILLLVTFGLFFFARMFRESRLAMWVFLFFGSIMFLCWGYTFVSTSVSYSKQIWKDLLGFPLTLAPILAVGVVIWMAVSKKAGFWRLALLFLLILASLGAGIGYYANNIKDAGTAIQKSFPAISTPGASPAIQNGLSKFGTGVGNFIGWLGDMLPSSKTAPSQKPSPSGSTAHASAASKPRVTIVDRAIFNYGDLSRPIQFVPGRYSMMSSNNQGFLHSSGNWHKAENGEVFTEKIIPKVGVLT
jgi:hypothetical protein